MEPLALPVSTLGGNNIEVTPDSQGIDSITVRVIPSIGMLYRATSCLNGAIARASASPKSAPPEFGILGQIRSGLEEIQAAVTACPEYLGQVRDQLEAVTRVVAHLLAGVEFPPMQTNSLVEWKKLFRTLTGAFNGLADTVNGHVGSGLGVAQWPQELVKLKSGGPATGNEFNTIIVNQDDLTDWVARNLPDGPLGPLRAPLRLQSPSAT
jgi:hypothetical protein